MEENQEQAKYPMTKAQIINKIFTFYPADSFLLHKLKSISIKSLYRVYHVFLKAHFFFYVRNILRNHIGVNKCKDFSINYIEVNKYKDFLIEYSDENQDKLDRMTYEYRKYLFENFKKINFGTKFKENFNNLLVNAETNIKEKKKKLRKELEHKFIFKELKESDLNNPSNFVNIADKNDRPKLFKYLDFKKKNYYRQESRFTPLFNEIKSGKNNNQKLKDYKLNYNKINFE